MAESFQACFFKFWLYVWLVFKSSFKSRVGYDGTHCIGGKISLNTSKDLAVINEVAVYYYSGNIFALQDPIDKKYHVTNLLINTYLASIRTYLHYGCLLHITKLSAENRFSP